MWSFYLLSLTSYLLLPKKPAYASFLCLIIQRLYPLFKLDLAYTRCKALALKHIRALADNALHMLSAVADAAKTASSPG